MSMRQLLYKPATKCLPASFFEKRQALQAVDDFRATKMVFIHIPRTGGFSVLQTVYHCDRIRHFAIDQLLEVAPQDVLQLPRFAVVRNSWDRAVSAYLFARQGGVRGGASMLHPKRYRCREFATFDTFVHEFLTTRDAWKLDGVFRPQIFYTAEEEKIDYVGRFDRMDENEGLL